jgi:hypothetical protein
MITGAHRRNSCRYPLHLPIPGTLMLEREEPATMARRFAPDVTVVLRLRDAGTSSGRESHPLKPSGFDSARLRQSPFKTHLAVACQHILRR